VEDLDGNAELEDSMNFQATEFEFRNRFWLIGGIFFLGFSCYFLDQLNACDALARLILGQAAGTDSPSLDRLERIIFIAGALLAVLAALIRSWATAYLHSSVVQDMNIHSDRLVADGPYRYLRNPLYFGNILLALGMGLLASRIGCLVIIAGMTLFCYRLILREEAGLFESRSESYRRYFEAVPRLFPSLRPHVPAGPGIPNWSDGFAGEMFIWGFAGGLVAFAATERLAWFWIAVGVGFGIYFLQSSVRSRRSTGEQ
jgi:protein-S-isoprenylcysteine O-methyltransferase Ste14